MRNPRTIALLLLLAVFLGVFAFNLAQPNEPYYGGHSLTYWLTAPHSTAEAETAVRAIGTNAIPTLLRWINYEPTPWKKKLASVPVVYLNPWSHDLLYGPANDKAMEAFALLGTNAAPAIPALVKLMRDSTRPQAAVNAIYALGRVGENALPHLAQALSDTNQPNHVEIIYSISDMRFYGVRITECLIPLMQATNDNDPRARRWATNQITRLTRELQTKTPSQ